MWSMSSQSCHFPQAAPQQWQPNAAKFNGHTTYGDDFTSKELPRQEPIPVREAPASPPFEGASTYDTDFNQKPLPQREQAAPQQWHPSPGKFSATTEYGSQFQGWALPHHKPGLGIAMVDGSFYPLINPGWEPPTQASVVVTSVVDDQASTNIQVYQGSANRIEQDTKIGSFSVRIPPAPVGVPQVEVVFAIDPSCTLTVAARDRITGEHSQIVVASDTVSPVKG